MQEAMPSFWSARSHLGLFFALLALFGAFSSADASKPRCRLEKIDLASFEKTGQIKAIGGLVELEGQVNTAHAARDFRLQINGKTVARAEKLEPFERTGQDLYIALLVEISALYAPAIEKIKETLKEFLESLPPRAKVKLILFGYEIEQQPIFMPAPAVSSLIDDINPDDQGDVQLISAINAGLVALNKVAPSKDKDGNLQPPPRKVMVVLSDGLNQLMDRKTFRRIGDLLRHSNVPLFPLAFSVRDDRGPLLNLGELAKRSSGTFRWVQGDDNLKPQFASLAEELRLGQVISFPAKKLELEDLLAASFTLMCGELKSAPFELTGAPPPKKSAFWKWGLGILSFLVGLWLAAQGLLFVLKRRMPAHAGAGPVGSRPPTGAPVGPLAAHVPGAHPAQAPALSGLPSYVPVPITPGGRVYSATLIGIGAGQLGGKRIKVEASLFIGKASAGPNSLVVPDDPTIGAVHCELRRDGAGFALFEMNAPSGTFVNDRRIAGPTRLQDGDILRLGEGTQFRFRLDD